MKRAGIVRQSFDGIGSQGEGSLVSSHRPVEHALVVEGGAEIVEDLDRTRSQRQRPLEIGLRLVRLSDVLADVSQIIEGVDRVWFERQRVLVGNRGLLQPARFSQDVAEIVVELGDSIVQCDRLPDTLQCDFWMPLVMFQKAHQMNTAGMVWIDGKNFAR